MQMKFDGLTRWAVVTADQRNSRRSADQVPAALDVLAAAIGDRLVLPFERTAGDEVQALTADPAAVVGAVLALTRLSDWHIGIGLGAVDLPLPGSTREARGPAYLAARTAVEEARNAPANLRLVGSETVGAGPYGETVTQRAEAALVMLRALVSRRTQEGWEIVDVLDETGSGKSAARLLGISPSAVSQRAARAARAESELGAALAESLLAEAMGVAR
ncbi:MAG: hypothetical protein QM582_10375 [Micropruina sp.]|uniref:hypothetical protein n=1 Tax=Micropruina sp. TaxID=2737536 RepID=UPI0039E3E3C4